MKTSYGPCGHFAKGVWPKRGLKVAFLQKPFIDEILKIYQQNIEKQKVSESIRLVRDVLVRSRRPSRAP